MYLYPLVHDDARRLQLFIYGGKMQVPIFPGKPKAAKRINAAH